MTGARDRGASRSICSVVLAALLVLGAVPLAARAQTTPRTTFWDLVVGGSYLYLAGGEGGLRVLDATGVPLREVGAFSFGEVVRRVAVAGTRAYLLGEDALHVVDVSDPTRPRQLGVGPSRFGNGSGYLTPATEIAASGNYVYTASGVPVVPNGGMAVVDTSDPAAVRQVGFYNTSDRGVVDVAVVGPYVYAAVGCSWVCLTARANLHVVDVSDPTNPRLVFDLSGLAGRMVVGGGYLYVGDGVVLRVVDVSDPTRPRVVGATSALAGSGAGIWDVDVVGNRVYVATTGSEAVWAVVDVSDPTRPTPVATYRAPEAPYSSSRVAARGTTVYLTSSSRLTVVDVSDAANAREVGFWDGVRFYSVEKRRHLPIVPQNSRVD